MIVQIVCLVLAFFLLAQSSAKDSKNPPVAYKDADAYEVYAAVLSLPGDWREAKVKKLLICSTTTTFEMCLRPEPESEKIIGPAMADYFKQNERPKILQPQFNIEKPYKLLTARQIESAFGQGGWEKFYKIHPDSRGYIQLSAVGFNTDKTVAVVSMGYHCGNLCGTDEFIVLQKRDGKWELLDGCGWIS